MLLDITKLKNYEERLNKNPESNLKLEFDYSGKTNDLLFINSKNIEKIECLDMVPYEPKEGYSIEEYRIAKLPYQVHLLYIDNQGYKQIVFAFDNMENQKMMAHTIRCMINNNQN